MTRSAARVTSARAMVASSQPLASETGARILDMGGTAADACVAMDAVLHVTEPTSTGLGGDAFALFHDASKGEVSAINASGRAPAAISIGHLIALGTGATSRANGAWVTVPGCCAGWADIVRRHGTMSLAELLAPAIRLADDGFAVGAVTAAIWERGLPQLKSDALTLHGRAPRAGDTFRNPALARTLRRIADEGPAGFYQGKTADAIIKAVRTAGGVMDHDDLATHASTWDQPVSVTYRGERLWQCPPNSQGLTALLALGVLDGFAPLPADDPQRWHLTIEAMRLAFADSRWWVRDPFANPIPLDALLSHAYVAERRALIDPDRATLDARRGSPIDRGGTVYHCAVDSRGNACSMASSHFMGFGTGVVPDECGFVLHNRALGFSLDPSHPNVAAPGKRPYHTVTPGLLTHADGSLWGPLGVMGGFMQPQGLVQLVTALVDDAADPQAALDRPRFCIDSGEAGGVVQLEEGVPEPIVAALSERGHLIRAKVPSFGRAMFGRGQVILRAAEGVLDGGSDRRADGCAIGA
jgi:gamma-glutamyltranspeptidase/glutathione hydrolase